MTATGLSVLDNIELSRTEAEVRIRTRTTVRSGDPFLTGHFPGVTIFPGVFFIDVLQQAAAAADPTLRLSSVRSARFTATVLDGDSFTMNVLLIGQDPVLATADCRRSDGKICARLRGEFDRG